MYTVTCRGISGCSRKCGGFFFSSSELRCTLPKVNDPHEVL